ncbi:hypothetical protein IRJ41_020328 [Triplophysa rosa]|uniref:Uncharacterized protein n=1 Tax=Triplophysa rosa TaxID=992332 RepID=A0A9W7TKU6_TRIRA|nr:hypothetical protein IRJ41_020328 [Triplophysa rosa]
MSWPKQCTGAWGAKMRRLFWVCSSFEDYSEQICIQKLILFGEIIQQSDKPNQTRTDQRISGKD